MMFNWSRYILLWNLKFSKLHWKQTTDLSLVSPIHLTCFSIYFNIILPLGFLYGCLVFKPTFCQNSSFCNSPSLLSLFYSPCFLQHSLLKHPPCHFLPNIEDLHFRHRKWKKELHIACTSVISFLEYKWENEEWACMCISLNLICP